MSKNFEYFNNALNTQSLSTWRGLENYIGFNSKVRVYNLPFGYFMDKVEGKFTATVIWNQVIIKFSGKVFYQESTDRPALLPDMITNNIRSFSTGNLFFNVSQSMRRIERVHTESDIDFDYNLVLRNITIPPEWTLIEEYDLFNGSYSNSELGTQISTLSNLVSTNSSEIEKLKAKGDSSDSGFVMEINESATIIAKVKEKESGKIVLELSTEIEDFEVKFELTTSNNEKRSYHISHNNPVEIDLPEKLSNTYNSWGLHLYREVLNISNFRAKTVNNYRSKEISFESNEFKIYSDTCDLVSVLGGDGVAELQKADITVSGSMKFYVAVIKSSESDENTFCIYSSSNTSEKLDTSFLDGIKQNPLSSDLIMTTTNEKSSILSWYKTGDIIDRIDNKSRIESVRILMSQRYSDHINTVISPLNNISSVSFLTFNKLFSDDEQEICKVKTINIEQVNDLKVMNPVIVEENELKSYGSNLDKNGHPYRISLNADNLLLLFAFRTNLSEWLITHSYNNVFRHINYNKLPGRITSTIMANGEGDYYTFLINNSNYVYRYNPSNESYGQGYEQISNAGLETNSIVKSLICDTVESLKESGSLEVYSLEPFKYKNSGLKTIFDSFSDISTIISSLVNTETGENLPVQNEDYIKLQNARMCCHQTISCDSNSSTPKVTNVEFMTLSEMIKVFISKSSEYLRTHEPTSDNYLQSLQKARILISNMNSESQVDSYIQANLERLNWIKEFRKVYNKIKEIYNKDISKFKSEYESSSDKQKVVDKIFDHLFTGFSNIGAGRELATPSKPDSFVDVGGFILDGSERYTVLSNFFNYSKLGIKKPLKGSSIHRSSFADLKKGILDYSLRDYGGSFKSFSEITEEKINKVEKVCNDIAQEAKRYKDLRLYEKYDDSQLSTYLYSWRFTL